MRHVEWAEVRTESAHVPVGAIFKGTKSLVHNGPYLRKKRKRISDFRPYHVSKKGVRSFERKAENGGEKRKVFCCLST